MKTFEVVYRQKGHCDMSYTVQAATATEARSIADRFVRVEAPGARFFSLREKQEQSA